MAGVKRLDMQKYRLNSHWIYPLLLIQMYGVFAQTDGNHVATVADANWTLILQGEWMIKFYAPWCPACQHLHADWENLGRQSESLGISVGRVDVTQQPGLSGRFLVTILPTIFHAKDGHFRKYVSARNIEDIQAYVVERKWAAVEPVPGWKSPSSLLMSGMATLFRLSVWIRQIHTYLTNTLGIPSWGSYVIFAIITLFMGLVLGLMLVLIADCIWPSRPKRKENVTVLTVKEDVSEDEVEDIFTEDKRTSDPDNESERVSEEESTEEDAPITNTAASCSDPSSPEGAAESSVRQRKPQGPNTSEGT
ncbi:thioredoxin-related transmembrane protein 4 isoform X6 [Xyrauchen texanus]|uniref:thioredoxin-related transmembrane protein 4 isoform X5 n=1 Tax=Xyrauchen texanus TaxID=154827 RepID=UPI00224267E6|nr:thioredoxin-related transmembrane protein 4 isoform X5 [Xyrauchen texanus]XP_052002144.1 thioredoxin-related transmembrane protein 4 isoform X6 [Xyrauchen texanus]